MSEPWTPGPWEIGDESHVDPRYRVLRIVDTRSESITKHAAIALVTTHEADARLIAAAPEMAALLERYGDPGEVAFIKWNRDRVALLARIRGDA